MQEPIICPNNIYINTTFNKQVDSWVEHEIKYRQEYQAQMFPLSSVREGVLHLFLEVIYPAGRA